MKLKFLILFILFFVSGIKKVYGETVFEKELEGIGTLRIRKTEDNGWVQYSISSREVSNLMVGKEKKDIKRILSHLIKVYSFYASGKKAVFTMFGLFLIVISGALYTTMKFAKESRNSFLAAFTGVGILFCVTLGNYLRNLKKPVRPFLEGEPVSGDIVLIIIPPKKEQECDNRLFNTGWGRVVLDV